MKLSLRFLNRECSYLSWGEFLRNTISSWGQALPSTQEGLLAWKWWHCADSISPQGAAVAASVEQCRVFFIHTLEFFISQSDGQPFSVHPVSAELLPGVQIDQSSKLSPPISSSWFAGWKHVSAWFPFHKTMLIFTATAGLKNPRQTSSHTLMGLVCSWLSQCLWLSACCTEGHLSKWLSYVFSYIVVLNSFFGKPFRLHQLCGAGYGFLMWQNSAGVCWVELTACIEGHSAGRKPQKRG